MYMCMRVYMYRFMYMFMYEYVHVCMRVYMCMYVYVCVCMCMSVCPCDHVPGTRSRTCSIHMEKAFGTACGLEAETLNRVWALKAVDV